MKIFTKPLLALLMLGLTLGLVVPTYAATSPNLGMASSFAVLAGTAVTNVPTSNIRWDVGLSPAAGSNIAGLTAAQVGGTIYAADATGPGGSAVNPGLLTIAKTDLANAYDGLAGGANANANCLAGYTFGTGNKDLVGLNLVPGVYCADSFTLTGTLTLSGSGVWVFRSASTLVTSGTANIVGGDPCNVWWQVPSSATLGTNTSFIGNILALTNISVATGATLNGRALARNAAVTLDHNTITNALCATANTTGSSPTVVPTLPNTGVYTAKANSPWNLIILIGLLTASLVFVASQRKKKL